jgi:hypothetical protein
MGGNFRAANQRAAMKRKRGSSGQEERRRELSRRRTDLSRIADLPNAPPRPSTRIIVIPAIGALRHPGQAEREPGA